MRLFKEVNPSLFVSEDNWVISRRFVPTRHPNISKVFWVLQDETGAEVLVDVRRSVLLAVAEGDYNTEDYDLED